MSHFKVWLISAGGRIAGFALLAITIALIGSAYWNITKLDRQIVKLATDEAKANWNKDQAFRGWATRHGGLYVVPDKRTPPNPYLAHLPNRDVVTTGGVKLTLMNPAYMMSQMTKEYDEMYGIKGKITGQVLINPKNAPDPWELSALKKFDKGVKEITAQAMIDGQPYVRFMRPMIMKKGCVLCHGHLGFKVGDIRGGVSVSIPLKPYFQAAEDSKTSIIFTHALIWFLAFLTIALVAYWMQRQNKEKRKSQAVLKESERNYRTILETLTDAFYRADADGHLLMASPSAAEMTGYSLQELMDMSLLEIYADPSARALFLETMRESGGEVTGYEIELRRKDGSTFWVASSAHFVYDKAGNIIGVEGILRDITQQKKVDQALRESEERYAVAMSGTQDGIWIWDLETGNDYLSPQWKRILGYKDDELENSAETHINLIHEEDRDFVREAVRAHLKTRAPYDIQYKMVRKSGRIIWVRGRGTATWDKSGKPLRMAGTITDITEKKKAEEMAQYAQNRLFEIINIAPEAIISIDLHFKIRLFTKGAERIFGYKAEDVLGKKMDMLLPERFRGNHKSHVQSFRQSDDDYRLMGTRSEVIGLKKDGSEFPAAASVSKSSFHDEILFTVILHDISERVSADKARREALDAAEKANKAKSEFLASMSHELRTPLNSILGFADVIDHQIFGPVGHEKYVAYAKDIKFSGRHLLELVNQILDIERIEAGKVTLNKESLAACEMFGECERLLRDFAAKSEVSLNFEAPPELPPLWADRRAVFQILVNLISNAIKFTPRGGHVNIEASSNKAWSHIKISDTGIGIPKDKLLLVKEPFARHDSDPLKSQEGVGLGLAIANGLVKLHGGSLTIRSEVNVGTVVEVILPENPEPETPEPENPE